MKLVFGLARVDHLPTGLCDHPDLGDTEIYSVARAWH
jgi:hypothetical protein